MRVIDGGLKPSSTADEVTVAAGDVIAVFHPLWMDELRRPTADLLQDGIYELRSRKPWRIGVWRPIAHRRLNAGLA